MADISFGSLRSERPSVLTRVLKVMESIAMASPRLRQIERLSAMTDAQLEARGLKRDEIVQHVFRDVMYI